MAAQKVLPYKNPSVHDCSLFLLEDHLANERLPDFLLPKVTPFLKCLAYSGQSKCFPSNPIFSSSEVQQRLSYSQVLWVQKPLRTSTSLGLSSCARRIINSMQSKKRWASCTSLKTCRSTSNMAVETQRGFHRWLGRFFLSSIGCFGGTQYFRPIDIYKWFQPQEIPSMIIGSKGITTNYYQMVHQRNGVNHPTSSKWANLNLLRMLRGLLVRPSHWANSGKHPLQSHPISKNGALPSDKCQLPPHELDHYDVLLAWFVAGLETSSMVTDKEGDKGTKND